MCKWEESGEEMSEESAKRLTLSTLSSPPLLRHSELVGLLAIESIEMLVCTLYSPSR